MISFVENAPTPTSGTKQPTRSNARSKAEGSRLPAADGQVSRKGHREDRPQREAAAAAAAAK